MSTRIMVMSVMMVVENVFLPSQDCDDCLDNECQKLQYYH